MKTFEVFFVLKSLQELAGGPTDTMPPGVARPVTGRWKENRYLDCPRLSLDAPAKDIKLASVSCSRTAVFFLVDGIPSLRRAHPSKLSETECNRTFARPVI